MNFGMFSLSLAVKDLKASREFYEKLGFAFFDGEAEECWVMLKNGDARIGLYESVGSNMITFNPDDVRAIQKCLRERGISLNEAADEAAAGPAQIRLIDPDGNMILVDQL